MTNQKMRCTHRQDGLTLIELVVVLGIMSVLFTLSSVNLTPLIPRAESTSMVDQIIADLKAQQTKSMSGHTAGTATSLDYGVHFDTNAYVLFQSDSYVENDPTNFTIPTPDGIQLSTNDADNTLIFNQGSGEIQGASGPIEITVSGQASTKVIELNEYGVVTQVE